MLGVSTYLQEYQPDYLEQAARAGARLVFTSLQMPELDYDHAKPVLAQVLEQCHDLGMSLVADVSPAAFSLLHVAEGDYDALRALGVDTIRLDYGFRDLRLVRDLQRRFRLVLNASVVSDAYLDEAVAEGVRLEDLSFMHNYYPRAETGLSREGFERANELFRRRGLSVQAFVRGDAECRFPLYEGLPTLECHRGVASLVATVDLVRTFGVRDVIVGDTRAHPETLRRMGAYLDRGELDVPCHLYEGAEGLYGQRLKSRKDQPGDIVRLLCPRAPGVVADNTIGRARGSIVMENEYARRYGGEVYLVKRSLGARARSNVIGFVDPSYVGVLDHIDAETDIVLERL